MNWPYDDDNQQAPEAPVPSWHCPDEVCKCAEISEDGETKQVRIVLLEPTGERMKGALCRVTYQGRVMNESQPNADGDGVIAVELPHAPISLLVEWAPKEAPKSPGLPYRCRYYVDLETHDEEAHRRRLHNLGFLQHALLSDNVRSFQRAYGYENVNGVLADIAEDLTKFHDEGRPPVTRPEGDDTPGDTPQQGPVMNVPDVRGGKLQNSHSFSPTKAKTGGDDDKPVGGGGDDEPVPKKLAPGQAGGPAANQGSAKSALALPTILEALKGQLANGTTITKGQFEFVTLYSEWTDPKDPSKLLTGWFWTFSDALLWEVPSGGEWAFWKGTSVEQPLPRNLRTGADRKRLVRLPCTGKEAQTACDSPELAFSQADLLKFHNPFDASADGNDRKVACILPTPELYDLMFFQADVRIGVNNVTITSLVPNALEYTEKVAKAIDAARTKAGTTGTQPTMLGTPGKIWAIADRMETWVCCCSFSKWEFACINYGFHKSLSHDPKTQKPKANVIQTPGGCHDWSHTDYSQIFVPIAGWCLIGEGVIPPGETAANWTFTWRETAAVYQDKLYCNLVRDTTSGHATPAPSIRYVNKRPPAPSNSPPCTKGVAPLCPPKP